MCLCELPFALLKTTAVIPFTVLIDGVNGRAVVHRLEASRTLLVLEIVGKPHTKSPRCFFYSFLRYHACSLLLSMPRVVCHAGAMPQDGSGGPRQKEQRHAQHPTPTLQEGGIWWRSVGVLAGLIQKSQGRDYPTEKSEGPKRGKALLWLETDQRHRCQRHSSTRRFFALSRLWNWRMCASS